MDNIILLTIIGTLSFHFKTILNWIVLYIKSKMCYSIVLEDMNKYYIRFIMWTINNSKKLNNGSIITMNTFKRTKHSSELTDNIHIKGDMLKVPSDGYHLFSVNSKFNISVKTHDLSYISGGKIEISTFFWNRNKLNLFLKSLVYEEHKDCIKFVDRYEPVYEEKNRRMMNMVFVKVGTINEDFICKFNPIFDGNIFNNIIKDYTKFKMSYDRYVKLGVSYKRGYLFYGPPGTGKTTMAMNIAKRVGRYCIFTSDGIKSNKIRNLLKTAPKNSVILFDDFDTYVKRLNRKNEGKETKENIALGDILGAIDDIPPDSGIILIATTNDLDSIDSALCRVGRFDYRVEFTYATKVQIKLFFLRYYSGMINEANIFSNILSIHEKIVMAHIQEILLVSTSPENAIEIAKEFKV